jgi:SAM-dependent methyltransferase
MGMEPDRVEEAVRSHYGDIATDLLDQEAGEGCCEGTGCCGTSGCGPVSVGLYDDTDMSGVPVTAARASLGCGNPTAVADLQEGEVVLDLGAGGGIDVLLSARRVGPTGYAYGLDATPEMVELATRNAADAGVTNVEFLRGDIAAIPLPDRCVDVILSNCVINLAANKADVFAEAYRVLRPGGRLAVSDIVIHGDLPAGLGDAEERRRQPSAWAGCFAGALRDVEYAEGLAAAGFEDVTLEITRPYAAEDLPQPPPGWVTALGEEIARDVVGRFAATTVRAVRPE